MPATNTTADSQASINRDESQAAQHDDSMSIADKRTWLQDVAHQSYQVETNIRREIAALPAPLGVAPRATGRGKAAENAEKARQLYAALSQVSKDRNLIQDVVGILDGILGLETQTRGVSQQGVRAEKTALLTRYNLYRPQVREATFRVAEGYWKTESQA